MTFIKKLKCFGLSNLKRRTMQNYL